jgi:hypothetical protein
VAGDSIPKPKPDDSQTGSDKPALGIVDARQKTIALGLALAKACFEAQTVDDAYYLLTNDVRAVLAFDRSVLITHMGGTSKFVSAGNQPNLETKSKFFKQVNHLAESLTGLNKGVLLSNKSELSDPDLPELTRVALEGYQESGGSSYLFCMPLIHNHMTVAHLILEFMDDTRPDQLGIVTLLTIAPFLAAALVEKWLLSKKPQLLSLVDPVATADARQKRLKKVISATIVGILCMIFLFWIVPFPFDVGGEAEVTSTDRHVAFCKIDGLIDKVVVAEGNSVQKGQILATLDSRDLDYKIKAAEKQFEILTAEMVLLKASGGEEPSKLAESAVVELKRQAAWGEVQYLKWQRQFLEIKSPVEGIIVTRDIESLAGKKLRAGEPFCELAVPGGLSVDVFVPEDRVAYLKRGQALTFYLAGTPWKGHVLEIHEVAPMAEMIPRLGNVFRVRALFSEAPPSTMVGMKGTGKIHVKDASLWFIVTDRLLSRWQRVALYF